MYSNDKFREELLSRLSVENISNLNNGLEKFLQTCIGVLDKLSAKRRKYIRDNNMSFVNKTLTKAYRKRSHLRNRFLKNR